MATCSVTSTPARFARCLANFQVDELLLLKKSVQRMQLMEDHLECPVISPSPTPTHSELPESMALMARSDRGGHEPSGPWHSDPHAPGPWMEQKPSKLQTLFQISITALAFLSFGGYLLCLIVQAIKSKGTTYFHPVATATTTSSNGNVKRIKIYRRSRRHITPTIQNLLHQDYATYMQAVREQRWRRLLT